MSSPGGLPAGRESVTWHPQNRWLSYSVLELEHGLVIPFWEQHLEGENTLKNATRTAMQLFKSQGLMEQHSVLEQPE